MRLFIAIPLSKAVKAKLCKLYEPIKNVRWQSAQQLHLTLQFIGEADEQESNRLQEKLGEIDQPAFQWILQGISTFPKAGVPKIIWAGVQKNESLDQLYQIVQQCCAGMGYEPSSKPFTPHITLARVKEASPEKVQSFLTHHQGWGPVKMQVQTFGLFVSRLRPEGAVHEALKMYPLKEH